MQLDAVELEREVNTYSRLCHKLERSLPPNALLQELRQDVAVWKNTAAVVSALGTGELKDRHWALVHQVLGGPIPRGPAFTVAAASDAGVLTHRSRYAPRLRAVSVQQGA